MYYTFSLPGEPFDFSGVEKESAAKAAHVLRKRGLELSVREMKTRFLRHTTLLDFVAEYGAGRGRRVKLCAESWEHLRELWNYTPRPDLDGRRPAELYMEAIMSGHDPGDARLLESTRFCPEPVEPIVVRGGWPRRG